MKLKNKYYFLRHGEAVSNVKEIVSCWSEKFHNPLTKKGVTKIKSVAKELKNKNINLIFASPLLRTKETAGIVAEGLGLKIKLDKKLRELEFGVFNGKTIEEFKKYFNNQEERVNRRLPKGENYKDLLKRMWSFLKEIEKKYKNKNILIVSHQAPLLILLGKIKGLSILESMNGIADIFGEKRITKGQLLEVN